ncbi:hypothetical protein K435DRAFT_807330 [Dendrothele bispora CBS 962.96]|uniref:Uncharacterized protein n=1 Tax=Dendrothele bispora (strain CBS 962.96) TaxID=1314807 RepID=A0A4S8L6E3_DENBC|nr:hypothetical protein K435DRAFT_807330 [Dendrothele bispora CBS 962.96]
MKGRAIDFNVVGVGSAKTEWYSMKDDTRKHENGKEQDTYDGGRKWYSNLKTKDLKKKKERREGRYEEKERSRGEGKRRRKAEQEEDHLIHSTRYRRVFFGPTIYDRAYTHSPAYAVIGFESRVAATDRLGGEGRGRRIDGKEGEKNEIVWKGGRGKGKLSSNKVEYHSKWEKNNRRAEGMEDSREQERKRKVVNTESERKRLSIRKMEGNAVQRRRRHGERRCIQSASGARSVQSIKFESVFDISVIDECIYHIPVTVTAADTLKERRKKDTEDSFCSMWAEILTVVTVNKNVMRLRTTWIEILIKNHKVIALQQ